MADTPRALRVDPLIALVGQPNCGKSTLFNALAGFKANTGNFPGTTVGYTRSEANVAGRHLRLIDLPGTYALSPHDGAERVTRDFLLSGEVDAVIVVLDASVLSRSVELAIELIETGIPMVVALNMMDDAARKGVEVDVDALSARLGVPVVPTVATRGVGVVQVVLQALTAAARKTSGTPAVYDRDVEEALSTLTSGMPEGMGRSLGARDRFVAVRLLEGDEAVEAAVAGRDPRVVERARELRRALAEMHNWPEESVFQSHRHAVAVDLFEAVARVVPRRRRSRWDRLDDLVMHPVAGFVIALGVMGSLFGAAFLVGDAVGGLVAAPFEALTAWIAPRAESSWLWSAVQGLVDGVAGGAGIVLPYLVPLLLMMGFYEDVGYLPRAAFLVDGLLHRIGLHGKSVIPLILGYGCNVPALMGTRILETPRDRLLTALLVPFVACSARTVVILALVGATMGPLWALGVYALNILVAGLVGRVLSALVPGRAAGLLMDIPPYRLPPIRSVLRKVWFRMYEFLVAAWPVLIAASIVMGLLQYAGIDDWLNRGLAPVTSGLLGLPEAVGVTLFFGILRKELSLVLLFQALGTTDPASVMTHVQLLTFTVFVTFYIPCVSTLAASVKEIGWRWTGVGAALNTAVALVAALAVRVAGAA